MRHSTATGFPKEISEIFEALCQELVSLHAYWDAFKQLYETKEDVAVLNATAPGAFALIQYLIRRELIMGICRITDPKESRARRSVAANLTLKQLLHVVSQHCRDANFIGELSASIQAIDDHCKPIRDRRNRAVGHLDLNTALKLHPDPLPYVSNAQIDEAMRFLRNFMSRINGYFAAAERDFVPIIPGPARNIVIGLREALRLRKLEYESQLSALSQELGEARQNSAR
jgi:hypothetical protein